MGIFIDSPTLPQKKENALSYTNTCLSYTNTCCRDSGSSVSPSLHHHPQAPTYFSIFFYGNFRVRSSDQWHCISRKPHSNLLNYNLWGKGPGNCLNVPTRRDFTLDVSNHQSNRVESHYSLVPVGYKRVNRQLNLPGFISPF